MDRLAVDRAIDDQMGDMDILRCELARHRLRDRAQAELRRRERGEAGAAAHAGSGAGKQDRAATARHHVARRLAAGQEAAIAGELPSLEEQPAAGLDQRRLDVGAGIEETDFDRSQLCLHLGEERLDRLFIAHIGADGARRRRPMPRSPARRFETFRHRAAPRRRGSLRRRIAAPPRRQSHLRRQPAAPLRSSHSRSSRTSHIRL